MVWQQSIPEGAIFGDAIRETSLKQACAFHS